MAESVKTSHLWDPDYNEKWKSSVIENDVLFDTLAEKLPMIRKSMHLCDKFWSLLLQRGVVDEETKARMQAYKQRKAQAASLGQHMMSVDVYKFHGFIWALVNSNQCHLAELLGFAVCDYLDVDVFLKSSAFQCPACYEMYTKAYILTSCGHYVCAPCVKGAQFICKDNKKEDVTCPVPECGKITEASPSNGNIGLEEDGDFNNLCEALLQEVTKPPAGTTEEKSTQCEEKDGKTTTEGKTTTIRKDNFSQKLQEDIATSGLDKKISCLQKCRHVLGTSEPGVKVYLEETVEKVKQDVDDWAKEKLGWYSSICQQVEKNLYKAVKWQDVASELSVLMKAKPRFLEGCLEGKVDVPKETVTDAGEKVITNLDSGCSFSQLFPYGGCGEQTFSYTVESISNLKCSQYSPLCMVRNLPWRICVVPEYDQPTDQQKLKSIAVYLHAEVGSNSLSWSCKATVELSVLNWKTDGKPVTGKLQYTFNSKGISRGYAPFILWKNLMDPENGFVKDDCIRLEARIIAEPPTWHEKSSEEHAKKEVLRTLQHISDRLEKLETGQQEPGD